MLHCDWCGEKINSAAFATIQPGGHYKDGTRIEMPTRTYHSSYMYSGEISEDSCIAHALALIDGADFKSPDAGMRWKLVPASEVQNAIYNSTYTEPALGTTPLADLGLTATAYKQVTKRGIFTVEHLVDARVRGVEVAATKTLARIDAALLERGLLPAGETV